MTVKDLIEELEKYDSDAKIVVSCGNGYDSCFSSDKNIDVYGRHNIVTISADE